MPHATQILFLKTHTNTRIINILSRIFYSDKNGNINFLPFTIRIIIKSLNENFLKIFFMFLHCFFLLLCLRLKYERTIYQILKKNACKYLLNENFFLKLHTLLNFITLFLSLKRFSKEFLP